MNKKASMLGLERSISYVIVRLANNINLQVERDARAVLGLSSTELRIMTGVANCPGSDQASLINLVALDRSVVSRGVKSLIAKGYLVDKADSHDGRKSCLTLSDSGKLFYKKTRPVASKGESRLLAGFSTDEKDNLFSLLERISNNINKP